MTAKTVRLDVGGRIYRVSQSLLETYPTSMLARMVSDTWNNDNNNNNNDGDPIFVDRNGDRLQFVLDYLRDPELMAPQLLSDPLICRELDYFGIPYDSSGTSTRPLPNLQPGLRDRAIKAGAWVFQEMGEDAVHNTKKFQKPGTVFRCRFDYTVRGYDLEDPLAKNGTYAMRGQELCAIANALSAEQLSELWIPEYGMQCSSIQPNAHNKCIFFHAMAVPFVLEEEEELEKSK